ncbi:putative elongator complex protein 2 [Histomonas meleagridis]|uniref:putative elongator complex protein 2 n=1 Tax=Histomonas meleagridis TaxID=135588 RepID=UPI00355A1762|nr:putative elongator complex protein 2 [Histomonas meleagridis]KAH0802441.1 putative elongator complex protein 2 [Histomonas meleagridis]
MIQAFGGCNQDPDAWDVSGNLLAYGSGPSLLIQNLETYDTVCYAPLKYGIITCVRFTLSGSLLIGTCEGNLVLYDPIKKDIIFSLDFPSSITHCAIHQNNALISTALDGVRLLELNETEIKIIEILFPELRCVSLNLYYFLGTLIIGLGAPDGSIMLYVPLTKSSVTLEGLAWTTCIKFCPESEHSILCAASSQEHLIRIWRISETSASEISKLDVSIASNATLVSDAKSFHVELFANLLNHNDWVNCVDFYGSKHISSASYDGQVLLWTASEGGDYDISNRLGTTAVEDDQSGFIGCKLLSECDVIAVSRNGGFSRWVNGESVRCFAGHFDSVTAAAWTTIGCFITTGLDNVARVYAINGNNYQEIARPLIHGHAIYDVVELQDDLYAFAADEKNVRVLMPSQCFAHIHPGVLSNKKLPFASMVRPLSLDNATIENPSDVETNFPPLTPSDFMKDRIPHSHEMWLTRWPEYKSIFAHERELRQMTVASDWFATGDDRGGFIVWDKKSLEKRENYEREPSKSLTAAIDASPDSTMLLLVLRNGKVKLIDPVNSQPLKVFNCDKNCYAGCWATNSQYFAIGGENGLYVYERDGTLSGHMKDKFVTAIQYISEYDMIVGLNDGEVEQIKYDPSNEKFVVVRNYQQHSWKVNDIRVNFNEKKFLTCGDDHVVLLQKLI